MIIGEVDAIKRPQGFKGTDLERARSTVAGMETADRLIPRISDVFGAIVGDVHG